MQLSIITNKEIFNDMFKKAVHLLQFLDLHVSILLIEIHENIQNLKLKKLGIFLNSINNIAKTKSLKLGRSE